MSVACGSPTTNEPLARTVGAESKRTRLRKSGAFVLSAVRNTLRIQGGLGIGDK